MPSEPCAVIDRSNGLTISESELREYAGTWVATRAGHIVASAESYAELLADPRRQRKDAAFFVPDSSNTYF